MARSRFVVLFASLWATACAPAGELGQEASDVIHGADDRRDFFESENESLRRLTSQSIAALIPARAIDASDPGDVRVLGPDLATAQELCDGERFAEQPTAARCGATLIADDLVITAGHCVAARDACDELRFVFGYYLDAPQQLHPIASEDVFGCREIVARFDGLTTDGDLDHAIVRLDRPATPRFAPVPVELEPPLVQDDPLAVVSFGMGLPAKIDSGVRAVDPRPEELDYFLIDSDTFFYSSGAGVFDRAGTTLHGIVVRGQRDLVELDGCHRAHACPEGGCNGGYESASYAHHAIAHLCQSAPQAPLCPP